MVKTIKKLTNGIGLKRFTLIPMVFIALTLGIYLTGCDTFLGGISGSFHDNLRPEVEFANVPANGDIFSYAPVIHWKGRDADGFVEYFSYADIIDSTALSDPEYYVNFISEEAWDTTQASMDTVYLLTEPGKITQHVFYLKCIDDRGLESEVKYLRLFRSNQQPRVPEIKLSSQADEHFSSDAVVGDTMYILDKITDTWTGIGINWRSSDPDDKDLYKIPLQYRFYLEKTPHDTIWQWVSPDWSDDQDVRLFGLETGHYILTVWARDDGYEICSRPASITFDVYRPTFEQPVLVVNSTYVTFNPNRSDSLGNVLPGTQIGDMWRQLLSARYPDVVFFKNPDDGNVLFKSFLGRFSLVIWISENYKTCTPPDTSFDVPLSQYVRVGGRLWVQGAYVCRNMTKARTMGLAESSFPNANGVSLTPDDIEFISATTDASDLPPIVIDSVKTMQWLGKVYDRYPEKRFVLPGVDIMAVGSGAEAVYYYNSCTTAESGVMEDDTAKVVMNVESMYYPPTPMDCLVRLNKQRVLEVDSVYNVTKGVFGAVETLTNNLGPDNVTVVLVSYPYGEPWSVNDEIRADYRYQPYSGYHLKPCAFRYERISEPEGGRGYEVRYRVAVFAFPLFFIDNRQGEVNRLVNSMLDWFFLSHAHGSR